MVTQMNSKIRASVLAVCATLGMGYSTVSLADPVTFTTSLSVVAPEDCTVQTTATNTNWDLTWTKASASDTKGDFTDRPAADPLAITVGFGAGAAKDCDLSGMNITATSTGVDVAPVQDQQGYYKMKLGENGYWRYAPVIADLKAYLDEDQQNPVTGDLSVSKDDIDHPVSATPKYNAFSEVDDNAGMGNNPSVSLSDNYLDANAGVVLDDKAVTLKNTAQEEIKSARVGVSALIASSPENDQGQVDTSVVTDSTKITLPFTVNVSLN